MAPEYSPLHVLMILESQYPSPSGGGAEAQVRTLARGLRARGHRVTVLTPLNKHQHRRTIDRVEGVPVCRLRYPHVPLLGSLVLWLRLTSFLWSRRKRYDAWHVHIAHYMGAVASALGSWFRQPVILKVSGWWELEQGVLSDAASISQRVAFRCMLHASTWQAISSRIAAALADKGVPLQAIVAISNAVDTTRFQHRQGAISPVDRRCLFVGRLVPEKGLDTLLRAFATASSADPLATLQLVGSGPLAEPLAVLARSLCIDDRVEFSGHRDDVTGALSGADIGVLPSRIEGLSNTLLECMSSGMPVIATRISGNEDFVTPGDNGWLCEPGDQQGLAACLTSAMLLPPDELSTMGERARRCVEQKAGLDVVLDQLLRLYRPMPMAVVATAPVPGEGT